MMDIIQELKTKREKTQAELERRNPPGREESPIAKLLDLISPYDNVLRNQVKALDERIAFYEDILKWMSKYAGERDWYIIDKKPWEVHEKTLMVRDESFGATFVVTEYLINEDSEKLAERIGSWLGRTFAENS